MHKSLDAHQKNKRKRKRCCSESEIVLKKPKESTDELPNTSENKESVSENLVASDTKASCKSKTEQHDVKTKEPPAQPNEQIVTDEEKVEVWVLDFFKIVLWHFLICYFVI